MAKKKSIAKRKAYKTFGGKRFTLYRTGAKRTVENYLKKYGIPKGAKYRIVKRGNDWHLYMRFAK